MSVALVDAEMTQFGNRDATLVELLVEAGAASLAQAPFHRTEVDHLYITESGGSYAGQQGLPIRVADNLALEASFIGTVEQTSAAGAAGVNAAYQAIESGAADVALVVGGERLTHLSTAQTTDVISGITHPAEYRHGVTLPSFVGLTARAYLERFDAPRRSLAKVAVKNHRNGAENPKAHLQERVDVETVCSSPIVADPLRLYDFCPISDGSAAVVLADESLAAERTDEYLRIDAVGRANDSHVVHQRSDPTVLGAAATARRAAAADASIDLAAVDVVELHDMFTILELLQLEALGFADHGEGWRLIERGDTNRDGPLPVNTSGGLKAKGHPIAASGIAQCVELFDQLLGQAGSRQVDAESGLACNIGGFGNSCLVTVLTTP